MIRDKVLILGNGTTRLLYDDFILHWKEEIWACNWAFKEAKTYNKISRIGTVHDYVIIEALLFQTNNNTNYTIWTLSSVLDSTKNDIIKKSPLVKTFIYKKGYTTGTLMILQALYEKKDIYLTGFDMGGPDIYQKTDRPPNAFRRQYQQIIDKFGTEYIHFVGNKPSLDSVTYNIKNDRAVDYEEVK